MPNHLVLSTMQSQPLPVALLRHIKTTFTGNLTMEMVNCLACFVYKQALIDHYIFTMAHTFGDIDHSPSNVPGTSQKSPKSYVDLNLGSAFRSHYNAGTALLIIQEQFTVVSTESPDPRRGLAIRYKSKSEKVNCTKRDEYVKQLQDQLTSRGDNLDFSH